VTGGEREGVPTFLSDLDAPELVHPVVYSPWAHRNALETGGSGSPKIAHRAACRVGQSASTGTVMSTWTGSTHTSGRSACLLSLRTLLLAACWGGLGLRTGRLWRASHSNGRWAGGAGVGGKRTGIAGPLPKTGEAGFGRSRRCQHALKSNGIELRVLVSQWDLSIF
jgi:hypothetical protein